MSLIVSATSGGNFKPCPAGVHDAICTQVEDLGYEYSEQYQKESRKVILCFEINEPMEDGRPWSISKRYTMSLSEKARLRTDLQGWRGKAFTEEELKSFDLEVLKGKQCQLQVIHNEKGGKVYANVFSILPRGKNSIAMTIVNTELPEWIAKLKEENTAAHAARCDKEPVVIIGADGKNAQPPITDAGVPF